MPVWREGAEPFRLLDRLEEIEEVGEVWLVGAPDDPEPTAIDPARWPKVRAFVAPRGRASQMNAGARRAGAEFLLFLHADSRIHPAAPRAAVQALQGRSPTAAAFRLAYREPRWSLRCLAWLGRALGALVPFALGDQGLAIRRDRFFELGGFPEVPILEDWIFLRRIRADGGIRLLPDECATSGRRFLENGIWRQLLRNARILFRHAEGVSPEELAREYGDAPPYARRRTRGRG